MAGGQFSLKEGFTIGEITLKLYFLLTRYFYKNDVEEYGWNNGVADYPTRFSGVDMVYYEGSIREAVD